MQKEERRRQRGVGEARTEGSVHVPTACCCAQWRCLCCYEYRKLVRRCVEVPLPAGGSGHKLDCPCSRASQGPRTPSSAVRWPLTGRLSKWGTARAVSRLALSGWVFTSFYSLFFHFVFCFLCLLYFPLFNFYFF